MKVLNRGKGQILLARRLVSGPLDVTEYGPCANGLEWVKLSVISRHQKTCISKADECHTKGVLLASSNALCGRISSVATKALVKEVFSCMHNDEIGKMAREDSLIIMLGNGWLARNVGNDLNRKYYTSSVMRLIARLLKYLREIEPLQGEQNLDSYIKPEYFDSVVKATLMVASVDMDDMEDLEHPSNAIKIGFDLKRVAGSKLGVAIKAKDYERKQDSKDFLRLMELEWGTKVTKLARVTLNERFFNKGINLPKQEDIIKAATYMNEEIKKLDLTVKDKATYQKACTLALAKLVFYNRRRSGEMQALK